MYIFEFWAPHNALLTVPVPGKCVAIPHCPARRRCPGESGGALCCRPSQHKSWVSREDCVTRSGDPKESQCPELGFAVVYALSPETIPFIAPTAQRSPPSALTMLKNGVEAKTIQAGVFEDPQDHLLWLGEQGKGSRNNDCCWWHPQEPLRLNAQACRGSFGFTGRANQVLRDDNKRIKIIGPYQGQRLKILCLVHLRKYLMRELIKRTF